MADSLSDSPSAARDEAISVDTMAWPSRIGPWHLVGLLGEGSWTRVFRARPASCGPDWPADYAIKILKPNRLRDPWAIRLLQREDLVGRQVNHPHLAPVLSSRIDRPPFFITLPLLAGVTLAQHLRTHAPLPVPTALWITRQTADALWALHRHGWSHGDVKPGNMFLSAVGHVTLIDLGFARRLTQPSDPHAVPRDATPAASTPAYAAPETHSLDLPADARSDTYSLGATLFEMLTGRRPFTQNDPRSLAMAHCEMPPPDVRELRPVVPRTVARLVDRMLAKDAAQRPSDSTLIDTLVDLEIATFHLRDVPNTP